LRLVFYIGLFSATYIPFCRFLWKRTRYSEVLRSSAHLIVSHGGSLVLMVCLVLMDCTLSGRLFQFYCGSLCSYFPDSCAEISCNNVSSCSVICALSFLMSFVQSTRFYLGSTDNVFSRGTCAVAHLHSSDVALPHDQYGWQMLLDSMWPPGVVGRTEE
jgi:hypothetical protein